MSASRICIGVDMPNLASAALACAQERYVQDHADEEDTKYLQTFVRADFQASMIRALRDKGWTCVGVTEPSQASNRKETAIRDSYKWDFICPVETVREQAQQRLDEFTRQ
jgi:hypothetical protein